MKKNKYFCSNRNEDGVALIFALTMLALLLILLIGFLAASILDQRTAYAIGDNTASRLLARGTLERIKYQMSAYSDDTAWMRFRSSDSTIIAPLVSTTQDGSMSKKTLPTDLSKSDEAYAALKPLLHRYFGGADGTASEIKATWEWRNFFPSGTAADYPQWIYYYNNPDKDQITGRIAYVVVPNFGIDPLLLGKAAEHETRIGKDYKELKQSFFVQDTTTLNKYTNYLSLDFMTAKDNLNANGKFHLTKLNGDYKAGSFGGTSAQGYKEFVNLYFTTKQPIPSESDWEGSSRTLFEFDALKDFATYRSMLDSVGFEPEESRDQVAANIVDYMDENDEPTSDVAPANWISNETTPKYTGNEKTPYINQIVPAVQLEANYNITKTNLPFVGSLITQTVSVREKKIRLYIELVNVYDEAITVKSLTLKNFKFDLALSSSTGNFIPAGLNFNDDVEVAINKSVPANGYAVIAADVPLSIAESLQSTLNKIGMNTPATLNITAKINSMQFDRAVLTDSAGVNIDCVDALKADSLPYTLVGTNLAGEELWSFSEENATKQRSAYASFEVDDPRCNLASDQWKCSWKTESALLQETTVPNYGTANKDVDASNSDIAEEKDVETATDPAKITAYIRNGVMKSPWELGFIHRGAPWQTINLKSLQVNDKGEPDKDEIDYLNDGLLMDKLRFSSTNGAKFNINYPPSRGSIFDLLTTGLQYHNATNIKKHELLETSGVTTLSDDAAEELSEYISGRYYDKKDKFYHHYVSRAQLVNVISNWARNGAHSPVKGLSDIHIEEFIGKIVPLTRCGDTFEYFTVFAVAQSIKDVKGTVYTFDGDGKIIHTKNGLSHGGTVESEMVDGKLVYFDKITSETFLVARLRRSIKDCKKYACCRQGIHSSECTFNVEVIESYTLTEP